MRLLGSICVALGLGAAGIVTDVLVENGSGRTSSFSVLGNPMVLPRWVLFAGLPMLGGLVVAAGWAGFGAVRGRRERGRRQRIRDEVAAAEARLAELGSMRRVMEELNFELSADHEKLQAKKLALAAEANGDLVVEAEKRRPPRAQIARALSDGAAVKSATPRPNGSRPRTPDDGRKNGNGRSPASPRSRPTTIVLPDVEAREPSA